MAKAPTPKQKAVLTALDEGKTFWQAARAADLSDSTENQAMFLMRLLDNGYISVSVTPTGRHQK